MDYLIEAQHLSLKGGRRYLIKDISWQVAFGEQWVVFGMNGSGKTTLLSIIAGFKHFTAGRLKVLGQDYTNDNILSLRQAIGFVSSAFYDKYYTRENVLDIVLSGRTGTLGVDENTSLDDALLARDLLAALNLADKINRQYDMLSKGERQNVLIARSLMNQPKLLILDEPASGLDVYNQEYLYQILAALQKQLSIVYVTHHADEITPIFNKCLLLKKGAVFAQGDMSDIFTSETMSQLLDYEVQATVDERGRMGLRLDAAPPDLAKLLKRR